MSPPTPSAASSTPATVGESDVPVFGAGSRLLSAIVVGALAFPMVLYVLADMPTRQHVALSAVLVGIGLLIVRWRPQDRLAVAALSVAVSTRYLWYRLSNTVEWAATPDAISGLLLFGAEAYAYTVLLGGYFQTAITKRRVPLALPDDPALLPTVDVYIPTYNESVDILHDTVAGALAMDYPKKTVWLLDDGRRPEMKELAERLGCRYLTRPDNKGAKAGNINHALHQTEGELVAMFDADHVPSREFLTSTVGFFLAEKKMALVQTPHHFYNPDHFERNLHLAGVVPSEQKFFYHVVQPGNDFWNSAFFCGSCALLSREALLDVGGMAEETLTEDAHTALKMHAKGWRSAYLDIPLAAGLATERQAQYITQRIRWARGMAQIFRTDNPLLKSGLSLAQRLNYLCASWHFMFGLPRLIFLFTPMLYLVFGLHPVIGDVREVLLYSAPHLALSWVGASLVNRSTRHSFWAEVFETVMAPYLALVTVFAIIAPKRGRFNVTDKGGQAEQATFDWRNALPTLVLLGCAFGALVAMGPRIEAYPTERDTIIIAGVWNLFNIIVLLVAAASAFEPAQRRQRHRVHRALPVGIQGVKREERWRGTTVDLSTTGLQVRVSGELTLPSTVSVFVNDGAAHGLLLPADVVFQRLETDGVRTVRLQFMPLASDEREAVSRLVFGSASPWLGERYVEDQPVRSFLAVLTVPFSVAMGNGSFLRRVLDVGRSRTVTGRLPCRACGHPYPAADSACEECGAPRVSALAERGLAPRRAGVLGPAFGLALLAFGAVLAFNASPAVAALGVFMPIERWTGPSYQTRMATLTNAYRAVVGLADELEQAQQSQQALLPTWSSRLQATRSVFRLGQLARTDADTRIAEDQLLLALVELEDAGHLFELRPNDPLSTARLASVRRTLGDVSARLGLPPTILGPVVP